ncbi:MAG: glycoside hydrolase family 5 protein [Actinomycetota bacterium]|nr:glycoside hydrolase family 5 protein [Actinomycetota bacterium]
MTTPSRDATFAEQSNRRLARTLNVGLDLGSPTKPGWVADVTDDLLGQCARAGFTAIRLVTSMALHTLAAGAPRLDPRALERVEQAINAATGHGLAVVLANMLDPELMADPPRHRERLLACTGQLAASIKHHGASVVLEPLSEPHHNLDPVWNDYLSDLCAAVREVDPVRTIIAGPHTYNNPRFLHELSLPDSERNLILTVHHYWPIMFTMQGETWLGRTELGDPATWLGTTWDADPQQRGELHAGFDAIATYARSHQRPVFIGEFGTSNNADVPSRVRWARFNRQLAEQHGFAWGYWSYGPTFALRDADHDRWHPELLRALIPSSTQP